MCVCVCVCVRDCQCIVDYMDASDNCVSSPYTTEQTSVPIAMDLVEATTHLLLALGFWKGLFRYSSS